MRNIHKNYHDENYRDPKTPVCPMCGKETDTYYRTESGVIVGCNNCLTAVDAWEY